MECHSMVARSQKFKREIETAFKHYLGLDVICRKQQRNQEQPDLLQSNPLVFFIQFWPNPDTDDLDRIFSRQNIPLFLYWLLCFPSVVINKFIALSWLGTNSILLPILFHMQRNHAYYSICLSIHVNKPQFSHLNIVPILTNLSFATVYQHVSLTNVRELLYWILKFGYLHGNFHYPHSCIMLSAYFITLWKKTRSWKDVGCSTWFPSFMGIELSLLTCHRLTFDSIVN